MKEFIDNSKFDGFDIKLEDDSCQKVIKVSKGDYHCHIKIDGYGEALARKTLAKDGVNIIDELIQKTCHEIDFQIARKGFTRND